MIDTDTKLDPLCKVLDAYARSALKQVAQYAAGALSQQTGQIINSASAHPPGSRVFDPRTAIKIDYGTLFGGNGHLTVWSKGFGRVEDTDYIGIIFGYSIRHPRAGTLDGDVCLATSKAIPTPDRYNGVALDITSMTQAILARVSVL